MTPIAKAAPGAKLLNPKDHSVRFEHKGMRIDLGGIAKGYAVDRGIAILQAHGVQHMILTRRRAAVPSIPRRR